MDIAGLHSWPAIGGVGFVFGIICIALLAVYGELHGWTGHNPMTHFFEGHGPVSAGLFIAYACTLGPIVEEVTETPLLREYLRTEIDGLLATPGFIDALPGYLLPDTASQARIGTVFRRLKAVASS